MSFATFDDDDEDGIDRLILSLERISHELDESIASTDVLNANDTLLTGWTVDRSVAPNENKSSSCRSYLAVKDSKDLRSSTPRKIFSRQRNRNDVIEFKHYLHPHKYIEEYRNEKTKRQEAALKELANKTDGRRASDSNVELRKTCTNCYHLENRTSKHVPGVLSMKEVQTVEDDNAVKPFIVVRSKGLTRPANLPMSGQFHGRKLQWRPSVTNRKIAHSKPSPWSQAHIDVTLEITSQGGGDVSQLVHTGKQSEDYNFFQERRSSANLVIKRAELGGSPTAMLRTDNKSPPPSARAVTSQAIITQCSPIEKCDAWVKSRENELGNFSSKAKEPLSAKPPTVRGLLAPSGFTAPLSLRGNSLSSPPKDSPGSRSTESSAGSTGMDYSKYTDMFKNVLEFYGTRRLRPKSHSAVEQLLTMKT